MTIFNNNSNPRTNRTGGNVPVVSQNLLQPSVAPYDVFSGLKGGAKGGTPLARESAPNIDIPFEEGLVMPPNLLENRHQRGDFITAPDAPVLNKAQSHLKEAKTKFDTLSPEDQAQLIAQREVELTNAKDTYEADWAAEFNRLGESEGPERQEKLKEEKGLVDKFAGEFDLFTLGAVLLATNDGEKGIGANLGTALMEARKAKRAEGSSKTAALKAQAELENTRASTAKLKAEAISELKGEGFKLSDLRPSSTDITSAADVLSIQLDTKPDNKIVKSLAPEIAENVNLLRAKANQQGANPPAQELYRRAILMVDGKKRTQLEKLKPGLFSGAEEAAQQRLR